MPAVDRFLDMSFALCDKTCRWIQQSWLRLHQDVQVSMRPYPERVFKDADWNCASCSAYEMQS